MHERDLIRLVQQGDREAMRQIYDCHIRYLTAVAQRYVDSEQVRDVLQESFIKIFSTIGRFEYRGEGSLRAWMSRIVSNESVTHLRREGAPKIPLQWDLPDDDVEESAAEVPIEVLHRMIRELPTGYRTIFNLYIFEGYSHREISQQLGIGESSSASQLHRAKAILAKKIKEYKREKSLVL